MGADDEVVKLALKIADDDARCTVQSFCVLHDDGWYEFDRSAQGACYAKRAIRYLSLRGKLERNPKNRKLVRACA